MPVYGSPLIIQVIVDFNHDLVTGPGFNQRTWEVALRILLICLIILFCSYFHIPFIRYTLFVTPSGARKSDVMFQVWRIVLVSR
jgi:hypothetical protein